jgi:NADP-dependent 3-hydroxy acid dehydrogenase YdfG
MKKVALITGATSGIGKATAHILAKNGYNLIITGRRKSQLDELKKEIGIKYKADVLTFNFDIREQKTVEEAIKNLPENWKAIDVLVNNAGLAAGLNPIQEGELDDWEQMIDTNIKGLLYITREVCPIMIANGHGHIINISSISGRDVYEKGNVYCATKFAVEGLTQGMRIDLLKHNIKVTAIAPGMVNTEFSQVRFKGDKQKADSFYEGFTPLLAEDVAEAILFAVTRPAHVNINEMLIMPTDQANGYIVNREKK